MLPLETFIFDGAPLLESSTSRDTLWRFSVFEPPPLAFFVEKKFWIPFRFTEAGAKGFFVAEACFGASVEDDAVKKDDMDF